MPCDEIPKVTSRWQFGENKKTAKLGGRMKIDDLFEPVFFDLALKAVGRLILMLPEL